MSAPSARTVGPESVAPGPSQRARPPRPGDQLPLLGSPTGGRGPPLGAGVPHWGPGSPTGGFTLPDRAGRTVRLWDFKQRRPVVLALLHGPWRPACWEYAAALAARRDDLAVTHAAVLVIVPGAVAPADASDAGSTGEIADPTESLAPWADTLTRAHILPLLDTDGTVTARYLPPTAGTSPAAVARYVADRYGACGLVGIAPDAASLPTPDAILAELAHADEGACGCLEPAWPAETDQPDGWNVPTNGDGS